MNVVMDRVVEQHRILGNNSHRFAQRSQRDALRVLTTEKDARSFVVAILLGVVQPKQQAQERALTAPTRADQGERTTRGNSHGESIYDFSPVVVSKTHVSKLHRKSFVRDDERGSVFQLSHRALLFQQMKHRRHVDQRLSRFAIHRPQKVQRHR